MKTISRRDLVKKIFGWTSAIGVGGYISPEILEKYFSLASPQNEMLKYDIASLLLGKPDKVDLDVKYLINEPYERREAINSKTRAFLLEELAKLSVPKSGFVVELGAFRGQSLDVLAKIFGENRCVGYDAYNYADHPKIIIKDVRNFGPQEKMDIAVGWNDTSTWKSSPRSKRSAHDYLRENIVSGGLLLEDSLSMLPSDIDLSGFTLVLQNEDFAVFRKS